ncbi:hypothetical protein V8G54_027908 [Vigna mungo]|uniref:Uncharacterized protein n=1 Tax=Vigna mungo TaxID=3915 RepID=A0AAQ3RK40_VIGMU
MMGHAGARDGGVGVADDNVGFAGDDFAVVVTGAVELPLPGDGGATSVEGRKEPLFPSALILVGESNIEEVQLDDVVTLAFRFKTKSCIVPFVLLLNQSTWRTCCSTDWSAWWMSLTTSTTPSGIAVTTERATLMSRNCGECTYDNGAGQVMVVVWWGRNK